MPRGGPAEPATELVRVCAPYGGPMLVMEYGYEAVEVADAEEPAPPADLDSAVLDRARLHSMTRSQATKVRCWQM